MLQRLIWKTLYKDYAYILGKYTAINETHTCERHMGFFILVIQYSVRMFVSLNNPIKLSLTIYACFCFENFHEIFPQTC